jgi:hypothetical protein
MGVAFDFPASPSNGQTFTPPGGPTYTWNGVGWTIVVASGPAAPVSMPTNAAFAYVYNTTRTEPPASGEIRLDASLATKLWIANADKSGVDNSPVISRLLAYPGTHVLFRDTGAPGNHINYRTLAGATPKSGYLEIPVMPNGGSATPPANAATVIIEFFPGNWANARTGTSLPVTTSATPGDLFFRTDTSKLFILYDNGTTKTWVQITP